MKILIIGDPHGKLPIGLTQIVKKNKIELIICTGDIPPVPGRGKDNQPFEFTKKFIKIADKKFENLVNKLCSYKLPVLTLRGNMYLTGRSQRLTKKIFSKNKNLYYKKAGKIKFNKQTFIFFDMIWEPEMNIMGKKPTAYSKRKYKTNIKREKHINKLLKENPNAILISHSPPHKILDKINFPGMPKDPKKQHVGSRILAKAVTKYPPKYCIFGHIHEGKGKKKIGRTTFINAGVSGDYYIIDA